MFIAEGFEEMGVHKPRGSIGLHLQGERSSTCACDVKGDKAMFVAALDGRTHSLATDIAMELPAASRNLFNIGNGLHQGRVADRHLRNPYGTEEM